MKVRLCKNKSWVYLSVTHLHEALKKTKQNEPKQTSKQTQLKPNNN